jgi:hypothetical protein
MIVFGYRSNLGTSKIGWFMLLTKIICGPGIWRWLTTKRQPFLSSRRKCPPFKTSGIFPFSNSPKVSWPFSGAITVSTLPPLITDSYSDQLLIIGILKMAILHHLQAGRNRARPVRSCCARRAMRQRQPRPDGFPKRHGWIWWDIWYMIEYV